MASLARDTYGAPIQVLRPSTTQTVAIGGSSAQSTAITSGLPAVQLVATSDCYVAFGSNPAATNTSMYLPALTPMTYRIDRSDKVAVLQVSGAGVLHITELG